MNDEILCFCFSLKDIADDLAHHQQPRRRSNSLPIPKIHVSLYQSPEMKKRSGDSNADSESKEFVALIPDNKDASFLTGESTGSGSGKISSHFIAVGASSCQIH